MLCENGVINIWFRMLSLLLPCFNAGALNGSACNLGCMF